MSARAVLRAALLALSLSIVSVAPRVAGADPPGPADDAPSDLASAASLRLEYRLHRHPKPCATLVFENGLGSTLDTWRKVAPALSDCCQWLLYNRAGIGRSEAPGDDAAPPAADETLLQLLQFLELPPPYVLIGHSLGGQYVQRFAQRHPDKVAGMVLVDALPPGAVRPYADFPWPTRAGLRLFAPDALRREIAAIHPMGETIVAGPGRFAGPMVRLVADGDAPKPEGLLKDLAKGVVYAEDFGVWATDPDLAEARMTQLYPQAELRTVREHHRLQERVPEQVIAAIRAVLDKACGGNPSGPG